MVEAAWSVLTLLVCLPVAFFFLAAWAEGSPRAPRRAVIAVVWIRTRIFPGLWRWVDAKGLNPAERFVRWWTRDPAEVRGEIDASP